MIHLRFFGRTDSALPSTFLPRLLDDGNNVLSTFWFAFWKLTLQLKNGNVGAEGTTLLFIGGGKKLKDGFLIRGSSGDTKFECSVGLDMAYLRYGLILCLSSWKSGRRAMENRSRVITWLQNVKTAVALRKHLIDILKHHMNQYQTHFCA